MKNVLYIIAIFCMAFSCNKEKEGLSLFNVSSKSALKRVSGSYFVDIDTVSVNALMATQPDSVRLSLPAKDGLMWINVFKEHLFAEGFTVVSDEKTEEYTNNSVFYQGRVEGEDSSLVSINIVNGNITGFISSDKYGEINIGRESAETASYMLYDPRKNRDSITVVCEAINPPNLEKLKALKKSDVSVRADAPRCVTKDFEVTYEAFQRLGSVAAVTNQIVNMFAAEKAIYKNESIELNLGLVYVWTTPDGYNTSALTALQEFGDKRRNDPAFKGNIAQLVRLKDGGALSGIAYVDILCNKDYRFSYAEPMFAYAAYPGYSWSIEVITHEDGHNIASPHTHNCNWELSPGVFGAIDNCYTTEGGCSAPTPCAGCGTIMSYCHMKQGVGIQFKNGFGPLPGDRLRLRVNGGACTICGTTPPPPGDGEPPTVPILTVSNISQTGCVLTWNACIDNVGVAGYDVYQNNAKVFSTTGLTYTVTGLSAGKNYGFHIVCRDAAGNFSTGSETLVTTLPITPPVTPPVVGDNIAVGKPSSQSSTYTPLPITNPGLYGPSKANDGIIISSNFSHTNAEKNPWYEIDLGQSISVSGITIYARSGCSQCVNRGKNIKVWVSNTQVTDYNTPGYVYDKVGGNIKDGEVIKIALNGVSGRYIKVMGDSGDKSTDVLHLSEVQVFSSTVIKPCRDSIVKVPYTAYRNDTFKVCN